MTIHSSILAWRIPMTEESGRLQSWESQRVDHDWAKGVEMQGWIVILCLSFWGTEEFLRWLLHFTVSAAMYKSSNFSISSLSQELWVLQLVIFFFFRLPLNSLSLLWFQINLSVSCWYLPNILKIKYEGSQ